MHIVVLVDSYYPNFSMNGIIAKNIVDELVNTNEVTVITYKDNYSDKGVDEYDGIHIHRVINHNICIGNMIKSKKRVRYRKGAFSTMLNATYLLKKIIFNMKRNYRLIGVDVGVSNKITKKLIEIHTIKPIDLVITITAPYEMTYSGLKFINKIKNTRLIPIQLDFFVDLDDKYYPQILKNIRKKKRISLKKEVLEACKMYFALDFLTNSLATVEYQKYQEKIIFIQHPLIKENEYSIRKEELANTNEIAMVYTGTLSKHERNPKHILEILSNTSKTFCYRFNIFHRGDCDNIIENYKEKMNGKIQNWGSVDTNFAYGAINSADILVSIGTVAGNQVAGKTFDYISTGKPIIYIYYNQGDLNLEYYKHYPLALCLNINDINYNKCALMIEKFYIDSKDIKINFDEIKQIYCLATPSHISSQILNNAHS